MILYFLPDLGMVEDDEDPVPLPNVNAAILKKVSILFNQEGVVVCFEIRISITTWVYMKHKGHLLKHCDHESKLL